MTRWGWGTVHLTALTGWDFSGGGRVQENGLGQLIDSLGITHEVGPDEQVSGAVVLLTVQEADGHMSLRCAWSDGMTWVERLGLLRAAERAELPEDGAKTWRV